MRIIPGALAVVMIGRTTTAGTDTEKTAPSKGNVSVDAMSMFDALQYQVH